MPEKVTVGVKRSEKSDQTLPLPNRGSEGAAGFDLRANISEKGLDVSEFIISPGKLKLIPTGLIFEIPNGFEGQIRPRSGLSLRHGITVLNSPGTIDSDYRGEVSVILANFGEHDFPIVHGERIAQIVFQSVPDVSLIEAKELSVSGRGAGGFGSSGVN